MRKILFLCVLSLLPEVASAIKYYDAYIEGIYYLFSNDNTAKVSYEYSWPKGNVNAYSGDVVIPETVTYNGVKYNVTSIRDGAFAGCSKLNSVTMGNSITSIDKYAFSQSSVTSIILGNGVTELADRPLGYCPQLTTLVFGKDLASIGAECVSTSVLKDIYCYAENPPACGNYALPTNSATLHVPESSLSKYKNDEFWGLYGNIVALKDGDPAPKGTEGSDGPTIIEPLLGSWKCISSTDATKSKTTKDLMVGVILTINSNGTYTTNSTDMGEQGNYIVKGNSLTAKASDKTIQATYSLNDNQLTISGTTNEGITFNYVFVKITSLNIERLVGTWECVSSIDKSSKETLTDIMVGEFLYIRDDGTYTTTSSEMGKKGTYKLLGNILTVKTEGRTIEIMLSLNGSQLTMTGSTSNGYSFTYVFEKVSSGIHTVHSQSPVIFSKNGVLTITGIAEGTPITVYSVAGMLVGSEVSRNGSAVLSTRLQPGSVAVVQIGSRKFKVAVW